MQPVTLRNVSKHYGPVRAVDGVSLEIQKGEFFFLLGPSGCGKTTLLRMMAGFIDIEQGDIHFGERRINDVPAHKRNTGMVFQNYALWPHMTVHENVAYGLSLRKVPSAERRRMVGEALDLVQLGGLGERRPNELSGGQQQRVALARALVIRPDVLLLDEPLSNLDAKLRLEMRHELRRIHAQTGITTIYVTHDQKEALSLAQRLAVLREGRILQVGSPREVYTRPSSAFVAGFIGQTNVLRGTAEPAGQDETVVHTPYGVLRARGRLTGPALCCIRPEAITLRHEQTVNRISGEVLDVTYLGDQEQMLLRLRAGDSTQEISLVLHNPKLPLARPGETVDACFDPDDVILIADNPA